MCTDIVHYGGTANSLLNGLPSGFTGSKLSSGNEPKTSRLVSDMALVDCWYRADFGSLPRGVVVADATVAASNLWDGPIGSILEECADQLPAHAHPDVVFLGDRRAHPLADVLKGLGSAHPAAQPGKAVGLAAQLGRYPVVGPLLHEMEFGPARPVLLLLNGPPIDLEDWAVPTIARQVLVYRLTGTDRVSPAPFTELGPAADLGALVAHLSDPVRKVEGGGETALALDWENEGYSWVEGALKCDGPAGLDLLARFTHAEGCPPHATVTRASGVEHRCTMVPHAGPAGPAEVPLTPAEGNVLSMWERQRSFHCRSCQRDHEPGRLHCPGAVNGPGLFPTVATAARAPLYRAGRDGGRWHLTPIPRGLLPLPTDRVLACRDGTAAFYSFDGTRWTRQVDKPGRHVALENGQFAIVT